MSKLIKILIKLVNIGQKRSILTKRIVLKFVHSPSFTMVSVISLVFRRMIPCHTHKSSAFRIRASGKAANLQLSNPSPLQKYSISSTNTLFCSLSASSQLIKYRGSEDLVYVLDHCAPLFYILYT